MLYEVLHFIDYIVFKYSSVLAAVPLGQHATFYKIPPCVAQVTCYAVVQAFINNIAICLKLLRHSLISITFLLSYQITCVKFHVQRQHDILFNVMDKGQAPRDSFSCAHRNKWDFMVFTDPLSLRVHLACLLASSVYDVHVKYRWVGEELVVWRIKGRGFFPVSSLEKTLAQSRHCLTQELLYFSWCFVPVIAMGRWCLEMELAVQLLLESVGWLPSLTHIVSWTSWSRYNPQHARGDNEQNL